MKTTVFLCTAALLSLFMFSSAEAGRQWYYQRVETAWGESLGHGNTAIGMRSGHAWPVVASDTGLAAMVPGGWVGSSDEFNPGGYIDAATSHDGQSMIFATSSGSVRTFGPSGWSQSFVPANTTYHDSRNSVAYTQQDNAAILYRSPMNDQLTLAVENNDGWSSSMLDRRAEGFALAYDSYNQANVALCEGGMLTYGTRGALTNNTWQFSEPAPQSMWMGRNLDLQLTANDIPYVVYTVDSYLAYVTYNRMQGRWENGMIDITMADNFCMASDQQGGIGVAYVRDGGDGFRLGFAYTDGSGGWNTDLLPGDIFDEFGMPMGSLNLSPEFSIGLAFDEQNNPVISFANHGETWIAYDPMAVPEPATCLLLLVGGAAVLRSRKK